MIKFIFAVVFFLAVGGSAFSQSNKDDSHQQKLLTRFNFLGIADMLDENFCIGLEHRFQPNWSVGTDAGWIFYSRYIAESSRANGVLVRPFIRYYFLKNGGGFMEAELHYKYVSYKLQDWLGRIPVNNLPTYEEYTILRFILKKMLPAYILKEAFRQTLVATASSS